MTAFVVVIGQLWYLQVLEGPRLGELSDRNRTRVRRVMAPRGIVYDRNGLALVDSRPAFTVSVVPRELEDRRTTLALLSVLLKVPYEDLDRALDAAPPESPWPVRLRGGLAFENVIPLEERRAELAGVTVEVEPRRAYPSGPLAAHLLGYVREATARQIRGERYRAGDIAGQIGIERMLDDFLRGQDGGEEIEVDAAGRLLRILARRAPQPGADVTVTLDHRIQEAAERALADLAGAVVVMDPRNGDILAMASAPAFDPARFAGSIDRDKWLRSVRDPTYPFLNRAFQAEYAPGSIFKLVVAAAALQEDLIRPPDRLPCPSSIEIGNRAFHNWNRRDQGAMDLQRAIATSCNTFFYRLGLTVGIERIARYARVFGFGEPTGIMLGDEKAGRVSAHARHAGDTANAAIGQGPLLVTPLQVARFVAAIANGGILWRPRLVERVGTGSRTGLSISPEVSARLVLDPSVLAVLRRGLQAAVSEGGTASAAWISGLDVAGKTGTAQAARAGGHDHAWFAGYAAADNPQVVVVVLVERGGMGGKVAAPIARQLLLEIFRDPGGAAS